ncbi:MAG: S41 family peptidase [Pyrinomonadaceae bacterium]
MKNPPVSYLTGLLLTIFCIVSSAHFVNAQKMDRIERERMQYMLRNIKREVKDEYYDPEFHGIDLDARFDQAEERLKQVETTGQALGVIAQTLIDFNDSHLYFLPPATNLEVEYGWRLKMFGDKCFITLVKPKSDAEAKGLKPGDQVLSVEGFHPSRSELWKMVYYYNLLSKRSQLKMTVLSPTAEKPRELVIESKIEKKQKAITVATLADLFDTSGKTDFDYNYFKEVGTISVWKMPSFGIDPKNIDILVKKIKNSKSLILDLRGNGGGYVATLERLAGFMFDRDLKIAELKGRKKMDPQESKTRGDDVYKGDLIVLIDHNSGSAAEIFARLVQLEKRGKVLGDVSAGAVMQARSFTDEISGGGIFYGASITNADVIMSDGKSLEHIGVIPDEQIVPTGLDLARQRDPVLSKALEMLGGRVSPEEAGKFFVYKWKGDRITIEVQ